MTERPDYTGEPGPTGPTGADGPEGPEGPPGTTTWAGITDKPTEFAPEAHKTSHQDGGADEIDATGLTGRVNYVDRGDPSVEDWSTLTLLIRDSWTDLNCSAIVPAGASAIHITARLMASVAGKGIGFRKNGNAAGYNALTRYTQVANTYINLDGIIACDDNRVIEYFISTASWIGTVITIRGWLI